MLSSARPHSPADCKNCDQPLTAYVLRGADVFCPDCAVPPAAAVKCARCGLYINGRTIRAEGLSFHPHCFVCDVCKAPLRQTFTTQGAARVCPACVA